MSSEYGFGWSPLDALGSPVFNILETASGLPGLRDTQFGNWLQDTDLFRGVRNFQSEQPTAAGVVEGLSYLVPYVGWGAATARAGARGLTGLAANAAVRGAQMFPRNPGAAFAVGETIRFSPLSAGLNAFDWAGGQQTGMEALVGFGLDSALGTGFQMAGHALSPAVRRFTPALGGAWDAVFQPGPELSRLYGFSDNVRRAAAETSRSVPVQEATSPLLEPQQRAQMLWDLIAETEAGAHPDVDVDLLRGQYDVERRAILHQEVDPVESSFRWGRDSKVPQDIRYTVDHLLRPGPSSGGNRVRIPITATGNRIDNPDVLAGRLELPDGWVHDTQLPGITQATLESSPSLRQHVSLEGEEKHGFRRISRTTGMGEQTWSLRQEPNGAWLAVTEIPVMTDDIHRMTGRARFKAGDPAEPAKAFFSFRTHNPSRFFPDMRIDTDMPEPGVALSFEDRIPRGKSDFLDKAMAFRDIYLSKATIQAGYEARMAGKGARQRITQEMLAGPTMGKEIARLFETYTAPTDQQLRSSPEGRSILGLYQALFDAADGRKSRLLHGMASIPEDKNPITALFSAPNMDDSNALVTGLRKTLQEDPAALEIIRRFDKIGNVDVASIADTPAGKWLELALKTNDAEIEAINNAIDALRIAGATDAKKIPHRQNHFGLSRKWDGSNFYPIYKEGAAEPIAVVAGGSRSHAERKADEWIAAETAARGTKLRKGQPFVAGQGDDVPAFIRVSALNPGLLEPRAGMRGYEHEFEPYKHVDDFITELDDNYTRRWRYAASVVGDALTGGKLNQLRARDPHAYNIVKTRIMQLKGQPGPAEQIMNRIVDQVAAPYVGTNSLTKASEAVNETMFHLLHGAGNIATPLLNLTSVAQTQFPEAVNFLTSDPSVLRGMGYMIPTFGPDGLPRPGMLYSVDPIGIMSGGVKRATDPTPEEMAVFQELFNKKEMGTGLANEYTGQDRTIAQRASEGIRGPEDVVFWAKKLSSLMMSKTEQISRTTAVGMALESMARFEKINGIKFTHEQRVANALKYVRRTSYGYFTADRPMMYTTPLGALFGNQKTWMTNYLFIMAEYFGLGAQKQNWAPLLMTLGTTTMLGGVFAVPVLGAALDAYTEFFHDQDAKEYIYSNLGEGGNPISFGLPALFGVSLAGNVSAPGSNLAHDASFMQSIVALSKAQQIGRAFGRAWDDQMVLGMNPLQDPLFQRQAAQALAPRSMYRGLEAILSDQITSAATGYPMVQHEGIGSRILSGLGFRDVDVALQYAAYDDMIKSRDETRRQISLFGEAYAQASLANNREQMLSILQQASVRGLDISRVMQSSQIRMRNAGRDMFGRNFTPEQMDRYSATLSAAGVE